MEWINTKESLPDKSCAILCLFKLYEIKAMSVEWYSVDQMAFLPLEDNGNVLNTPTHWMHLPELPKV